MSDFTPSLHDILPIKKVMIQSVVMKRQWSNVSLCFEEVRVPGSILKEWEYLTLVWLYWGSQVSAYAGSAEVSHLVHKSSSSAGALVTHNKGSHVDICKLFMQWYRYYQAKILFTVGKFLWGNNVETTCCDIMKLWINLTRHGCF